MEWLTLAVGLLGGLGIGSWITGWRERGHASAEARRGRRFQIRFEAYKAASQYLLTHEQWVNCTEPVITPAPEAPDLSPDDEWIEFGGLIAVTASDTVRNAMQAAVDAEIAFDYAVTMYRRRMRSGEVGPPSREDLEEARRAAIAEIQNAQTVMRDELADLWHLTIVYAVVDDSLSPTSPLGDAIETFIRREDAERFVKQVRGDDAELASYLRIEERELEAGGLN